MFLNPLVNKLVIIPSVKRCSFNVRAPPCIYLRCSFSYFKDSEEMKSTTLDVKLKETERELKQHEKEIADQMEVK